MATEDPSTIVRNRETTSLRIVWQDLSAEAKGIPAISIVVAAIIVVFVVLLWRLEPLHFTF
jgi:flagellar biosynthesis/type III secretory pathway M-ring protein FliF/YscJ